MLCNKKNYDLLISPELIPLNPNDSNGHVNNDNVYSKDIFTYRLNHLLCNTSNVISLETLCYEFLISRSHNSELTKESYARIIRNHIAPYYEYFQSTEKITMSRLGSIIIHPILDKGMFSTAATVISLLIMIINHASITHEDVSFKSIKNLSKVVNMKKKDEYEVPQKAMVNKNIGRNIQQIFNIFRKRHPKNKQVNQLLMLSFFLCLRQREIVSIKVGDIDFKKHNLHIRKTKTIKRMGFDIPMCPILEKLLQEIIGDRTNDAEAYIFTNRNNRMLNPSTLECYLFKTELKGIQTAHGIRAIFSTWASRNNKDSLTSECVLTHKNWSRVQELYNRDLKNYLYNKRKKLMTEWINYVNNLITPSDNGNT